MSIPSYILRPHFQIVYFHKTFQNIPQSWMCSINLLNLVLILFSFFFLPFSCFNFRGITDIVKTILLEIVTYFMDLYEIEFKEPINLDYLKKYYAWLWNHVLFQSLDLNYTQPNFYSGIHRQPYWFIHYHQKLPPISPSKSTYSLS